MPHPAPGTQAWLDLVREDIIDPARPIIDPHHHLWRREGWSVYELDELWADTGSGHRIEKTVFLECRSHYHEQGPTHLRPIGETEYVHRIAMASRNDLGRAEIAGIVAHADLTHPELDVVLDAHMAAGHGLFRGIRHSGARDPHPDALSIPGRGAEGLYRTPAFIRGVRQLGKRGLTYDTWHYHHQNRDFAELARQVAGTTLVLDHFGTPLGVGVYRHRRAEIFEQWKLDIAEIARCPNVCAKLGGLAMPDNGFAWDTRDRPATSDELVAAQEAYYHHCIQCFGPARCMFESNFPVDRRSLSYHVYWNAMKKIASRYSAAEQNALFFGTAMRVYRL